MATKLTTDKQTDKPLVGNTGGIYLLVVDNHWCLPSFKWLSK